MMTSPAAIKLRSITRKLGLNRIVSTAITSKQYEDRFGNSINSQIKPGDVVWDIGANLGIYTKIFSHSVSPNGKVVAYEPASSCFEQLQEKFSTIPNVELRKVAIGSKDEFSFLEIEKDPLAPTHKIVDKDKALESDNLNEVEIRSADSLIASEPDLIPNIIKIDVEGYEGQVIDGMKNLLNNPKLKCVGVEVHFGLLSDRGEANRPKEIERVFKESKFTVRWTDSSHIIATR